MDVVTPRTTLGWLADSRTSSICSARLCSRHRLQPTSLHFVPPLSRQTRTSIMQHAIQLLASGWEFKQCGSDGDEQEGASQWLPVEQVPSEVHADLMQHRKIPDPFADLNELAVRWVADKNWKYRVRFESPEVGGSAGVTVDLVFEGLDTFATVRLNGRVILESDNMFIEHRINVTDLLLAPGSSNTLEIAFEPARRRGLESITAHPEHDFIVHQTEVSRGAVRKAQYTWGWDWGPILLTCGPWKPIRLETWCSRIGHIKVDYHVDTDGDSPVVNITAICAQVFGLTARVEADLWSTKGGHVMNFKGDLAADVATGSRPSQTYTSSGARLENVNLWWPRGYGTQTLYQVRLQIIAADGSTVLTTAYRSLGFRKVELVQEKDHFGQSFYFRINNVDIFSGGSCWIPADSITSRITPERYRDWLELLANGQQNMVRVWGGGIYEADDFYAACDELGIMVWQDFMFACASYPTHPEFLESVETEARQAVRRLRCHPSLVLWCGNNEDYQLIERYGLEYRFGQDKSPDSWLKSTFPARYIYEHLLPRVVSEETNGVVYHPGSPWGDGTTTTLKVDPNVGDIHQWNVWHGDMKPYQNLPSMGGRFVSEFGMEGYPHLETIHKFVTKSSERYPGSTTMDFHNKAVGHERRLFAYVSENYRLKGDLPSFTHLTQVMQADAVSLAFKSWRRQWGTPGARRCGGVLVWQLNDCWPTVSWAVVDYFLVKKPAYYSIKRALAPVAVGVTRKFHDWTTRRADKLWRRDTGHVDPTEALREVEFDAWVANSSLEALKGRLVVRFVSTESGQDILASLIKEVNIQPNGCTEVTVNHRIAVEGSGQFSEHFVIHASLEIGGERVSSDTSWPEPIKYLDLTNRGVRVKLIKPGVVEVTAEKPTKGFVFSEKQGVNVSDNGFDLIPGDKPTRVWIQGIDAGGLQWTFVGQ
ncbi:glycoside hydrolase family 2 protein [Apodospora peruviana]|uniref:Beta-mannosidase B n=1 Tax=Apodospora peruviana TaxID=516989 RepID=A0AAE0M2S1_9PEZI|nr:glycoside hydrolase family 2 protein [Apodospora peruviana]